MSTGGPLLGALVVGNEKAGAPGKVLLGAAAAVLVDGNENVGAIAAAAGALPAPNEKLENGLDVPEDGVEPDALDAGAVDSTANGFVAAGAAPKPPNAPPELPPKGFFYGHWRRETVALEGRIGSSRLPRA